MAEYRASPLEQERTADILRLMPSQGNNALDIGARDGYFSLLMIDRFETVVALDLSKPSFSHPKIHALQANAAKMPFPDQFFDFVFCAQVLEHIPALILNEICQEIERVANHQILIGVPYKQDIRIGRTTCYSCGKKNPPWGHVNSFDEQRIANLFNRCKVESTSFVGINEEKTNWLSTALMDFAGNPQGTYHQEGPCIYCGQAFLFPPKQSPAQRVSQKLAILLNKATNFKKPHGNWMHMLLHKLG